MTQEIADALGRVPGLRVAVKQPGPGEGAGTSGAEADPRTLGRAMRVETVLTGSVQRSGDLVRVAARLVNTEDGFQIWADKFDGEIADVFALQDDVARAIVAKLKLTLAPGVRDSLVRVVTTDPEAYNLYLQGMYFWNRRGSQNIYKSVTYFKRAIERDPRFARAWAGLALAYAIVITWDDVDVPTTLDLAFDAARRALALDSTTSDAWTATAEANQALWRNSEATDAFKKAIALDPNNATAHQWYAEHLAHLGRFEEARARIHIAQRLAPLSLVVNTQEGRIELQARRFTQAKKALDYVLELDSTYRTAHALLGAVYLQQREFDKAIASFRRAIAVSAARRTIDLSFSRMRTPPPEEPLRHASFWQSSNSDARRERQCHTRVWHWCTRASARAIAQSRCWIRPYRSTMSPCNCMDTRRSSIPFAPTSWRSHPGAVRDVDACEIAFPQPFICRARGAKSAMVMPSVA